MCAPSPANALAGWPGSLLDCWAARTSGVSRFCSSQFWQAPAGRHLRDADQPPETPWEAWGPVGGWSLLVEGVENGSALLARPRETLWGFGCPILGPDPLEVLDAARRDAHRRGWADLWAWIPGCSAAHSLPAERVVAGYTCLRADLRDGTDAWLARRTNSLRANVRNALRRAERGGVVVEFLAPADWPVARRRLLAIERRSWKWAGGDSVFQVPQVRAFYLEVGRALATAGALELAVARRGEEDLAYVFGGRFADEYRGLQQSYAEGAAGLSLGSVLQWAMMERVAAKGAQWYDLGMALDYKEPWADHRLTQHSALVRLA